MGQPVTDGLRLLRGFIAFFFLGMAVVSAANPAQAQVRLGSSLDSWGPRIDTLPDLRRLIGLPLVNPWPIEQNLSAFGLNGTRVPAYRVPRLLFEKDCKEDMIGYGLVGGVGTLWFLGIVNGAFAEVTDLVFVGGTLLGGAIGVGFGRLKCEFRPDPWQGNDWRWTNQVQNPARGGVPDFAESRRPVFRGKGWGNLLTAGSAARSLRSRPFAGDG